MSEVNEYADRLLKRNKPKLPAGTARRAAGRPRSGSVLAGKKHTVWEAKTTYVNHKANRDRWIELMSKPLNKWEPDNAAR